MPPATPTSSSDRPLDCTLATEVGIPGGRRLVGVVGEAAGAGEMKGRRQVDSAEGEHPGLRGSQALVPSVGRAEEDISQGGACDLARWPRPSACLLIRSQQDGCRWHRLPQIGR